MQSSRPVGFGAAGRATFVGGMRRLNPPYDLPIMVRVSRKSFLGSLSAGNPEASLIGTVAANLAAAAQGARIFRVHDVAEHVAALKVFHTLTRAP